MSLDVRNAAVRAGGETFMPAPFWIEGLRVQPPTQTRSSQATGDDSTSLRAGVTGGRARLVDYVKDFAPSEVVVASFASAQYQQAGNAIEFSAGNAVWFTAVLVQHRVGAGISLVWVPGDIAAVADAAVPTLAEIEAYIDAADNQKAYVILGDILFHRSADTVVTHRVSEVRRPAYVDETKKTGVVASEDDQTTMGLRFHSRMAIGAISLALVSAATAGDLIIDGLPLPNLPFGGKVGALHYVPTISAVGSGADGDLRLVVDGTALTDDDVTITETSDVPTVVSGAGSAEAGAYFKAGDLLDVEVQAKTATFSAGQGMLLVDIWECVPN